MLDVLSAHDIDVRLLVERLAPNLRIAHQVRGRVRLKLDVAAMENVIPARAARQLDGLFKNIRGIRSAQLNLLARSCVVEYDADVIPDAAWPDLIAGRASSAAAELVAALGEKYDVRPGATSAPRRSQPHMLDT